MENIRDGLLEFKDNLMNGLLGNKTALTIVIVTFIIIMIFILFRNKISERFNNWIKKNTNKKPKNDDEIKL